MRYLSVCSGIEAASCAWESLGWTPVAFAEVEAFPSAVLRHRYPHVPNLGDFTKIGPDDVGPVDLLVGGTPCFASGTLVTLDRGLVPIEDVRVGDRALTHEGTFERVLAVGSKSAPTVRVRGQSGDVTTTAEHRFWSSRTMSRSTRRGGVAVREATRSAPEWTAAKDLVGAHVATPAMVPPLPVPPVSAIGREREGPAISEQFMWCAGAWLGDGWTRVWEGGRRGAVIVCAARGPQARELERNMRDVFGSVTLTQERTTERLAAYSLATVRWLRENFGSGAAGKTVPTWLLGAPEGLRRAFLAGYLFADGSTMPNGRRCTTVSPRVALGIAMLAHTLGFSTSRYETRVDPTTVIEGRTVTQRPWWQVSIYDRARSSWTDGRHRFGLCRSVEPTGRTETVHDLTVERSNSYVAAGLVVHNCQDFSVAGLRAGLDGDRGQLTVEFVELARRTRPRWLVWENVPGVLSADGGGAFGTFLRTLGECGYGFAYRVLDAQYAGVPQRRRRVFVVGHLGDWRRAAAVLFERHGLSGHPAPRRETRQEVAGTLGARPTGGGGFGTDFECDGGLTVASAHRVSSRGSYKQDDVGGTLRANGGDLSGGGSETFLVGPLTTRAYADRGDGGDGLVAGTLMASGAGMDRPAGIGNEADFLVAHTLRGEGHDASEDGTGRGVPIVPVAFALRGREEGAVPEIHGDGDTIGSLRSASGGSSRDFVAFACKDSGNDAEAISPTLRAMSGTQESGGRQVAIAFGGQSDPIWSAEGAQPVTTRHGQPGSVATESAVRRLNPVECERLQGFPDGWTDVPYRGKPVADGPRYRALGNSMAVPVMRWIGERIAMVDAIPRDGSQAP